MEQIKYVYHNWVIHLDLKRVNVPLVNNLNIKNFYVFSRTAELRTNIMSKKTGP